MIPGVGMLLHQAALSEKIWLDIDMPIKIIKDRFFSRVTNDIER